MRNATGSASVGTAGEEAAVDRATRRAMALARVLRDEMNHYIKERQLAGPQMPPHPPGGADLRRLLKLDCALSREAAPGFLATLLKSSGQQINADN